MDNKQDPKPLPNRPAQKLPPIPKGSKIQKRPIITPVPQQRQSSRHARPPQQLATVDVDGYRPPPRATHTVIIKVSSKAPFMSIVKRVRKALDARSLNREKTKGLPLTARIAALEVNKGTSSAADGGEAKGDMGCVQDALDDVVLVGTGKAIAKLIDLGAFFMSEKELMVLVRTRSVKSIDDVIPRDDDEAEDADVDEEPEQQASRIRYISCMEVGIRWKSA